MTSNNALATLLLKGDRQVMGILANIVYYILKSEEKIDLETLEDA